MRTGDGRAVPDDLAEDAMDDSAVLPVPNPSGPAMYDPGKTAEALDHRWPSGEPLRFHAVAPSAYSNRRYKERLAAEQQSLSVGVFSRRRAHHKAMSAYRHVAVAPIKRVSLCAPTTGLRLARRHERCYGSPAGDRRSLSSGVLPKANNFNIRNSDQPLLHHAIKFRNEACDSIC